MQIKAFNGVELDMEKARTMMERIIKAENSNAKTKAKNFGQMVAEIKSIIKEEAKCD